MPLSAAVCRSLFCGATLLDTGPLVGWFDRIDQDHGEQHGIYRLPGGEILENLLNP